MKLLLAFMLGVVALSIWELKGGPKWHPTVVFATCRGGRPRLQSAAGALNVIETLPLRVDSVPAQQRKDRTTLVAAVLAVVGAGLAIGFAGAESKGLSDQFPLAFTALLCVAVAILLRPIAGVFLTVSLSVLGDASTMGGYPFNANFSSYQSFLYMSDKLTFSPIEVCLALTALSWFAHIAGARSWHLLGRPLLWPLLIFAGCIGFGVLWGVGLQGGDLKIAIWELRPLLYLVAIYILASNLFTRTAHYVTMAWLVVVAISIQNIFAIRGYWDLSPALRSELTGLTDHTTSLLYTWIFLLTLALCVLRGCSRRARVLLLLASLPTAYVFVLSQRRAAMVALGAGFIFFAIVLFFRRRKAFFVVVPIALLVTVGYTTAFWNTTDGIGFGAQAVKSVIAPNSLSASDASSDQYRKDENFDLSATVRAKPLTGIGFGKPFYRPRPLADISIDPFNQFIPHNSIIFIWLKLGYLGFAVMFVIIATVLRAGTRAAMRLPSGNTLAVTVAALCFVVMFFVFSFVDISWGPQPCLFLGVCMATCANVVRLAKAHDETLDDSDFEAFEELTRQSVPSPR